MNNMAPLNLAVMTEPELKTFFKNALQGDFHITPEVWGIHLIEQNNVCCDFLIAPRPHLIERGFDDIQIAVEVKSNVGNGGVFKANAAVWQAATYGQSTFNGVRPAFSMVFPEPRVFCEDDLFSFDPKETAAAARIARRVIEHLAQFMNVGFLTIGKDGYSIQIGSQRYYSAARGKGGANLIKRYVGNTGT